jgi:uncharacterized membrane protein YkgB
MEMRVIRFQNQLYNIIPQLLRVSFGVIYVWFGILKFFPNYSPAEEIAKQTVDRIVLGLIPTEYSYFMLAALETTIGVCLLFNLWKKYIPFIALGHLVMTFSPLLLFPSLTFNSLGIPTLLGQYVLKNLVLFWALLMINHKTCYANTDIKT